MAAFIACCVASGARAQTTALLWTPPDPDAPAARVRNAFSTALEARGMHVTETAVTEAALPSLASRLDAALADYSALRLDEAARALDAIVTDVTRLGGGDLDRSRMADLFLHVGLTQQELAHNERAWDAFVEAARVDPTRALDPARVPPRAAAAFRRAVAELAREPRAQLTVRVPSGARVRVDGEEQSVGAPLSLAPGTYFIQVACPGFETWRGTVLARPAATEFAPPLVPLRPPAVDAVARADEPVLFLALYRREVTGGWRVSLRTRRAQRSVEIDEPLAADANPQMTQLLDAALGRREVPIAIVAPPPRRTPLVRRWWLWTSMGVAAAALAVGLGVGLTQHGGHGGSIGGSLEPIR